MECSFSLSAINLRGQRWGQGQPYKVIALHGWLDNSASFELLKDHLAHTDIVAIDMAGHGKSGCRAGQGAYNIWQDISEILEVADQLDWPEFTILAHSRGAMAATLLAGSFPERVAGLVLIDAIYPRPLDESLAPLQLRQFVEARMDSSDKRSYFPDYERAIKARSRGLFPIELSLSRRLAERGVSQSEQGYYWHHDAGLMLPSEFKLSAAQIQSFIHGIRCPVLVFAADQGLLVNADYHLFEGTDCDIQIRQVQGPHHAHFCELDALVQTIAEETHVFLSTL